MAGWENVNGIKKYLYNKDRGKCVGNKWLSLSINNHLHRMLELIIDGNNFSDLSGLYDEVERKLTKGLDWKIGRNLNAFNDVLRGGFGVHEYEEPYTLRWINAEKSKNDLNEEAAEKQYFTKRVFEEIVAIIREHSCITLILE